MLTTIQFSVLALILSTLALSLPLDRQTRSPAQPSPLDRRSPVSADAFSDWATNFIMLGSDQQYGGWIPPDGNWYSLSSIQCLDLPAYAIGACSSTTVDNIAVAAGYGPCTFIGGSGFDATIAAGSGWTTVGPPQTMISAKCG